MQPSITTVPLLQLASGDRLSLQTYRFVGAEPGKKAYLQANLHGAELAGNAVLHQLMAWLMSLEETALRGEIWLVPVCNPLGVNQRATHFASGRFNPYDGKDWNRIFWDYETESEDILAFAQSQLNLDTMSIQQNYRQRIQTRFAALAEQLNTSAGVPFGDRYRYQLQSFCLDADYIIDLHTSSDQGLTYLYYFRGREDSAALFSLPAGILLDQYDGDAFDEAFIKPWLALEDCFASLGRSLQFDIEAWTLELGSAMQLDPESVASGLQGVKQYLAHKGLLASDQGSAPMPAQTMRLVSRSQVKRYYSPVGGMIQARVPLGTQVTAGQRIYQVLQFNKDGTLPIVVEVYAETEGLVFDVAINQAVNEGEYVLGIM
ncbi:succinylglutamate desuccinylase/aspartoacylase family protein [Oculatella sp. LEGE 06141]|uniref:succinylglutamate desuccinylase/aspartoacylase family protein n=1 Tax=Oculatella sp. LEGE 06141 TaxID=1828648 RepID=UPI0018824477|nr:succinylglutamate desuccinylase/aspartoacylase family protein [Oculatella sp. LEGE 06141]MBE9181263.1 succinylglutamate desuccinylase/aspartoacylase family protein [Oculatella sp. LEGE 06141]